MPNQDTLHQTIIEIQKTVTEIQQSMSNRWWQNILLVLAGAIPAALVAWINFYWNKRIFSLTKEKEEQRIRAELVAELKALQYRYWKTADEYIAKWALHEFQETLYRNNPSSFNPAFKQTTAELREESIQSANEMIEHETELAKLLAKYNYLVKDKKIDELIEVYKATAPVGETYIKDMPPQQLINNGVIYVIETARVNYYEKNKAALGDIVDYLMYGED